MEIHKWINMRLIEFSEVFIGQAIDSFWCLFFVGSFIAIHIINRPVLYEYHPHIIMINYHVWCILVPEAHARAHAHDKHYKLNGFCMQHGGKKDSDQKASSASSILRTAVISFQNHRIFSAVNLKFDIRSRRDHTHTKQAYQISS